MSLLVPIKRNSVANWPGFSELEHQLDRVFNTVTDSTCRSTGAWTPAVDIQETDDSFILDADLPGLTKEDIEVKVVEDRVVISGTRKEEAKKDEGKGYWHRERVEGAFKRSFQLRGGIDGSHVEAHFENGVLRVRLPKPEETKPRQIEVKVN